MLTGAIGMTFWSLAMAVISVLRMTFTKAEKYSPDIAKEELMGSVLGVCAAGYFTTLLGKGYDKRSAEES